MDPKVMQNLSAKSAIIRHICKYRNPIIKKYRLFTMVNENIAREGPKSQILRWVVNTAKWQPTRHEWITAMHLVGDDIERNRINRYVYKRDAKHALIGRLLIRKCCEHFFDHEQRKRFQASNNSLTPMNTDNDDNLQGINSSDDDDDEEDYDCSTGEGLGHQITDQLLLKRSDKGKPILIEVDSNGNHAPYNDFQFNISHSGDYCALAADTSAAKLGIDLMKIEYSGGMNKLDDFFNIMHKQFSAAEWRYIRQPATDYGRLSRFIRLWTLKESFVKAEGSGIIFPLSKISFECLTDLTTPSQRNCFDTTVNVMNDCSGDNRLSDWIFEESMIDVRHYVSVAKLSKFQSSSKSNDLDYQFRMLTIKDLIPDDESCPVDLNTFENESYWIDFCRKS